MCPGAGLTRAFVPRRSSAARASAAEGVGQCPGPAPLGLRDRHAAGARAPREIAPDRDDRLTARHAPAPSRQIAISLSSQV